MSAEISNSTQTYFENLMRKSMSRGPATPYGIGGCFFAHKTTVFKQLNAMMMQVDDYRSGIDTEMEFRADNAAGSPLLFILFVVRVKMKMAPKRKCYWRLARRVKRVTKTN